MDISYRMPFSAFRMTSLTSMLALGLAIAACTQPSTSPSGIQASPTPTPSTSPSASPTPVPPSQVLALDPTKFELAEGLVLDKNGQFAYTATAAGRILKISLADGTKSEIGSLPTPPSDNSVYVVGLAFDSSDNLYIAAASFGTGYQGGIYKLAKGSNTATIFVAGGPANGMFFPNGIAVAADDSLFVSDSTGKILKVSSVGTVTTWFSEADYTSSDASSSCKTGFNIGANGIVLASDAVYFTNSDRAALVKVLRNTDGSAGAASFVVPSNCATFRGADGLALTPEGTFLVASNQQNALLAVDKNGAVSTVASGALFNAFPSSVAYDATSKTAYVINAAFGDVKEPRLVKVPLGN